MMKKELIHLARQWHKMDIDLQMKIAWNFVDALVAAIYAEESRDNAERDIRTDDRRRRGHNDGYGGEY